MSIQNSLNPVHGKIGVDSQSDNKLNKIHPLVQTFSYLDNSIQNLYKSHTRSSTDEIELLQAKAQAISLSACYDYGVIKIYEAVNNPLTIISKDLGMTGFRLITLVNAKQQQVALDVRKLNALSLHGRTYRRAVKQIDKEEKKLKMDTLATVVMLFSILKYTPKISILEPITFMGSHVVGAYQDYTIYKGNSEGDRSRLINIGSRICNVLGIMASCISIKEWVEGGTDSNSSFGTVVATAYSVALLCQSAALFSRAMLGRFF